MREARWARAGVVVVAAAACACPRSQPGGDAPRPSAVAVSSTEVVESIFDGGLAPTWRESGRAERHHAAGPARITMTTDGTWILAKPGLTGSFGALVFRLRAPKRDADFLEVRVDSKDSRSFPRIKVSPEHRLGFVDEWAEISVPVAALDPDGAPFDRIVFRAFRPIAPTAIEIDKIGLTRGPPSDASAADAAPEYRPANARVVPMSVDCRAVARKISPRIYGIALSVLGSKDTHQWKLGASSRRWGGNTMSRYNFETGAWNTANDWFFENIQGASHTEFLRANLEHGLTSALTVPMLGWVAKDTSSVSFPVSKLGEQQKADIDNRPDAGNGRTKSGKPIPPLPPTTTSEPAPPERVQRWIESIRRADRASGTRSVHQYILDNEPALWSSTHRDVHPTALTYDELLERTIAYGSAVRAADPDAEIAGPAEWGWPAYFFSAKDSEKGLASRPDRLAHGDVPLTAYYLQRLRDYEAKTGTRVLDVLDFHFYPQAEGLGLGPEGKTDARTNALRIRSTRALWDPTYVDESWIHEAIQLIPRMTELVAKNYPGRAISIGEYNFGAETHISGGLAVAEALGRFAQGGVASAYYWTYPPEKSPAFFAFRAYRDFDGQGGRFLDYSVPTRASYDSSLFASRDEAGKHMVLVVLSFDPNAPIEARVDLSSCGRVESRRVFAYAGSEAGFVRQTASRSGEREAVVSLAPYSINVIDIELADAIGGATTNHP